MKLDILAFGAHPDDVEISCGATLLKYAKEGKSIGIIDLTEGELGTRGSSEKRYEEANKAAEILGLKIRQNLNMGDGFIAQSEENKLKIDYGFYISNQIMKPVQQLFALVLEKMPEFQKSKGESLYKRNKQNETLKEKYTGKDEFEKKYEQLRNKEVESLMFTQYLKPKRVRKKKITKLFYSK